LRQRLRFCHAEGVAALLAKALAIAVITYAPCPHVADAWGCAIRPNLVYVSTVVAKRRCAARADQVQVRNHELGHVIDYELLTNSDRGMFEALMHDARPWRSPPNSPHEQFAEAVRLCAISVRWLDRRDLAYGYLPTRFQHRKVCRWLESLGTR
jgi:hypothetical protein